MFVFVFPYNVCVIFFSRHLLFSFFYLLHYAEHLHGGELRTHKRRINMPCSEPSTRWINLYDLYNLSFYLDLLGFLLESHVKAAARTKRFFLFLLRIRMFVFENMYRNDFTTIEACTDGWFSVRFFVFIVPENSKDLFAAKPQRKQFTWTYDHCVLIPSANRFY